MAKIHYYVVGYVVPETGRIKRLDSYGAYSKNDAINQVYADLRRAKKNVAKRNIFAAREV